jgi:hypothetical protein
VSVSVKVVDTGGIECRRSSDDTMDFVALGEKKLGKVTTVLSGDTSDKCTFNLGGGRVREGGGGKVRRGARGRASKDEEKGRRVIGRCRRQMKGRR